MASEIETALKELITAVVKEAIAETRELFVQNRTEVSDGPVQLLTAREAAQRLSISQRYLYTLTRSGVLPCVRIGQSVRYSVATIQNWIRQSESIESPPPRTITTKNLETPKPVEKATPIKKASSKLRSRTQPRPAEAKVPQKKAITPASPKTRKGKEKAQQSNEDENQRNPFAELLAEIGIDRSSLPPLTNGELMRISETNIVTYHGWMYLNRPFPEEAREKLKKHFLAIVSRNSEG